MAAISGDRWFDLHSSCAWFDGARKLTAADRCSDSLVADRRLETAWSDPHRRDHRVPRVGRTNDSKPAWRARSRCGRAAARRSREQRAAARRRDSRGLRACRGRCRVLRRPRDIRV